jgi:putative FmdB family regulatory protein
MPTYQYACKSCGHDFEAWQKMSDSPLKICPSCNQENVYKKISATGFQLKGNGWYATDFKNSTKSSATKSDSPCATGTCPAATSGS